MTAMIGFSRFSTSKEDGGAGFNSFSPDVLVGWFAQNWLEFYAEVYGQTRTGPNRGPGYNLDAGVIFLINKSIAFDVGIGKSLAGTLAILILITIVVSVLCFKNKSHQTTGAILLRLTLYPIFFFKIEADRYLQDIN
ncbi:transporter [Legionella sainthelensi]|uniref:transporter n=1 Tax=Legionella sainthelensi TaxID=28087 RepID=UPI000FE25BA3|nr:transporter [Legionella sainthelensi]